MPKTDIKKVTIEDAELVFINFSGEERMYNSKGTRNFCVFLPEDLAQQLAADGFNVKMTKAREEGEDPRPYIKVNVNFSNRPPRITMITSSGRTILTEDTVGSLDYLDLQSVDLIFQGSDWEQPDGRAGTSAYLQTMFVMIEEDVLERKYASYEVEDNG